MYCLRCGTEIPEDQSFCDSCREAVSQPLVESPYLNTQIRLPVRKPKPPKAPQKKQERKNDKQAAPKKRGPLIAFLTVLCLLLAAAGLAASFFLFQTRGELAERNKSLTQLTQSHDRLTHRVGELNGEYVLISPSVDKTYHRLDCPEAAMQGFYLIRGQAALVQGYEPCPFCQ